MKTTMTDELAKDERHNTVQETRYWCYQYKIHARTLERALRRCYETLQQLPAEPPITPEEHFQQWVRSMGNE